MRRVFAVFLLVVPLWVGACGGDEEPMGLQDDAGQAGDEGPGFALEPTSLSFGDVDQGSTDTVVCRVVNLTEAPLEVTDVRLIETVQEVRFATSFIADRARNENWIDNNGDGHDFESRTGSLVIGIGDRLDVEVQFRPTEELVRCLDREPAPCGFLSVTAGGAATISAPVLVPR